MLGLGEAAEHIGDTAFGSAGSPATCFPGRATDKRFAARNSPILAPRNPTASDNGMPATARHTVLLIAQMPLLRDGLIDLLQEKCQDISFIAGDARSDEDIGDAPKPDLILVNTELEPVAGKWLRAQMEGLSSRHKGTPALLISGLDMAMEAKRAIDAGFVGFVPSTQSSDQLIAAIRLILAGGRFHLHLDQVEKNSHF